MACQAELDEELKTQPSGDSTNADVELPESYREDETENTTSAAQETPISALPNPIFNSIVPQLKTRTQIR